MCDFSVDKSKHKKSEMDECIKSDKDDEASIKYLRLYQRLCLLQYLFTGYCDDTS